ncbi:DNA cytosine methyltransferase [Mariniblastus sp.]|nr:DNA cytosine methyltransferase [Mariniblastus sp.]
MSTTSQTERLVHAFDDSLCKRAENNNPLEKNRKRFLALLGMLQSGVSPYCNRFMGYWDKDVPAHYGKEVSFKRTTGKVKFNDAWMLIVAQAFATREFVEWKSDMPALATHWLDWRESDPEQAERSVPTELSAAWNRLLQSVAGSDSFKISNSRFPLNKKTKKPKLKFIDLFAGVGGFHYALQQISGKCVFSSEFDQNAKETYFDNYGKWPFGDITQYTGDHSIRDISGVIPEHDILAAGFPCQPFSQAGQKKGFDDARGTLFFDVLKIAMERQPKALFLENVKGLKGHDKGNTFKVICDSLRGIGYKVYTKVISAKDFGVPQNRQRIFIVAFLEPFKFQFPKPLDLEKRKGLKDILEAKPNPKFTITDRMWSGHKKRKLKHQKNGNGFGYSLFKRDAPYVNTISARYWKDGSEVLIDQGEKNPRTLTPLECARLQGFPDNFFLHQSKKANYKQFGNSVAVPVIEAISREIAKTLENEIEATPIADPNRPLLPCDDEKFDRYEAVHY